MRQLLLLSAALLFASAPARAGGGAVGALEKLEEDPSPAAAQKLKKLYEGTKSVDKRVWILHSLGERLKRHADETALEELLKAAQKGDPALKSTAYRALSGFEVLPEDDVRGTWLARLDAAAAAGIADPSPIVRDGAADLLRTLERWKDPDDGEPKESGPEEEGGSGFWSAALRAARWAWVLILPGVVLGWVALGFPLFEKEAPEGRLAASSWDVMRRQRLFTASAVLLWMFLAAIFAGYGFDLLALFLGEPLYMMSGRWLAAYFACGACVFLPGAMLAAGLSERPEGCTLSVCLRIVPWALVNAAFVLFVFGPLELLYRLFLRSVRIAEKAETAGAKAFDAVVWVLETGSFRAGYLASCVMSCEGTGLFPALTRCRALFPLGEKRGSRLNLAAFDPRFALMCAAPLLAFFCALLAGAMPVRWHVSRPIVLAACVFWAWTVLAVVLFAVLQGLEGAAAACRYLRAIGRDLPERPAAFRTLGRMLTEKES